MNFEAAGVLLYDKVLDKLYSVTEESKSEEMYLKSKLECYLNKNYYKEIKDE